MTIAEFHTEANAPCLAPSYGSLLGFLIGGVLWGCWLVVVL